MHFTSVMAFFFPTQDKLLHWAAQSVAVSPCTIPFCGDGILGRFSLPHSSVSAWWDEHVPVGLLWGVFTRWVGIFLSVFDFVTTAWCMEVLCYDVQAVYTWLTSRQPSHELQCGFFSCHDIPTIGTAWDKNKQWPFQASARVPMKVLMLEM